MSRKFRKEISAYIKVLMHACVNINFVNTHKRIIENPFYTVATPRLDHETVTTRDIALKNQIIIILIIIL